MTPKCAVIVAAILAFSVTSCSFESEYVVEVHPLDFLPPDQLSAEFTLPDDEARDIYLLPYLEVLPAGTVPELELRQAYPVEFPEYDAKTASKIATDAEITLRLESGTVIQNRSASGSVPDGTAHIYVAPLGDSNAYAPKWEAATTEFPGVPARAEKTARISASVALTEEIISAGGMRVGVRLRLPAATSTATDTAVHQEALSIEVSGFPLRALP